MKMRKVILLIPVFSVFVAFGQRKLFTIAEATNGLNTTLAIQKIKSPTWQPGTDCFWQVVKKDSQDIYKVSDFSSQKSKDMFVPIGSFPDSSHMKTLPTINWLNKESAYVANGKNYYFGTFKDKKWNWQSKVVIPANAESITVDKSGKIAYTVDNNLWYCESTKGHTKITNESNKDIICGQAVHRNEFGIEAGIFFSPKGNSIAYYRMDQTMVKDYPIIKWDTVPALAEMIKYPMAGGVSHEVTLCVYNPQLAKTVVLKTVDGEKDHYLTSVTWSPDEKNIYVALLNRDQNHLKLNKYDAATGEFLKTLFEERNPKYVHPTHNLVFLPNKENEFIWWSERDGFEHLYIYGIEGELKRQLTKGEWVVNEIAGFDSKDNKVIITASKESPLEKHIYSVSLETNLITRIDTEAGMHSALLSDDGKFVFDAFSSAGNPRTTLIRKTTNGRAVVLLQSANTLINYDRPTIKNVTLTAADGKTTLDGKIILPLNFDKNKKYPVIVYLYNGPNVQLLHNSFPESGNLWYEYMAQHGFIVFTMDGRGSWNRGLAFEQATFRHLGEIEMEDQLKGVAYLKSLPYVDTNRMGVHGWSFGGFMTTSLMVKHPNVFKCGVAGGPVMDWKMYEVMYTERYMDRPTDNAEGYATSCLLDKVKNLKGKLLLIHGANDDVVVWQHSIDFIKKSVEEGVQVDYFVYPGHQHNVRGKDRVHLMEKISQYFIQNL